jgi:hypothetical protein
LREPIVRVRGRYKTINDIAFKSGGVLFVHLCHPSKGNGNFGAYIRGEGTPGEKRRMAQAALAFAQ